MQTEEMAGPDTDDFLEHYGVKGMKWGVRKKRTVERTKVKTTARPGQRVTAKGGTGQKPSDDAVRTAVYRQKAKASTTDALSNKELKAMINRMQLEQQYAQLRPKSKPEKAKKFIGDLLLNQGKQQANKVAGDFATQQVASVMSSLKNDD